jgi:hypothetical protein
LPLTRPRNMWIKNLKTKSRNCPFLPLALFFGLEPYDLFVMIYPLFSKSVRGMVWGNEKGLTEYFP